MRGGTGGEIHSSFFSFFLFCFFPLSVHSETMTWWMSLGCNPFIPCGGGKREFDSSFGLSEPESLWAEPPLPSNCEIFFLIIFLSFARRFWNQIFTWGVINDTWLIQSAAQPFYSNYSNGNAGKFKNTIKKPPKLKANKQKAIRKKSPKVKTKQKTPPQTKILNFCSEDFFAFFCINFWYKNQWRIDFSFLISFFLGPGIKCTPCVIFRNTEINELIETLRPQSSSFQICQCHNLGKRNMD